MSIASRKSPCFLLLLALPVLAGIVWYGSQEISNVHAANMPAALTGIVTSDAEGPMEGVLVKAKRAGGTITISVVTDDHGRYAFPAERLQPGEYALAARARGYDLPKTTVTVSDKPATADLKLSKVTAVFSLAEQLSPAEWIMIAPAPPKGVSLSDCGS